MKRRPERLIRWIKRSGRREIEPEIFISSSCVGDQFQNLKLHRTEKMASTRPTATRTDQIEQLTPGSDRPA